MVSLAELSSVALRRIEAIHQSTNLHIHARGCSRDLAQPGRGIYLPALPLFLWIRDGAFSSSWEIVKSCSSTLRERGDGDRAGFSMGL